MSPQARRRSNGQRDALGARGTAGRLSALRSKLRRQDVAEKTDRAASDASLDGRVDDDRDDDGGAGGVDDAPGLFTRALHRLRSVPRVSADAEPPDGGAFAWLMVLCAHLAAFNAFGYINSFGVFQAYYVTALGLEPSRISWIGSLQVFFVYSLGTVSGRLCDLGYFHATIALGFALQVVAAFTTAECTTYWQLMLSQGLCQGLGNGLLFCPVIALVSTYFSKRRPLALSLVACAGATGGLVFPSIAENLLFRPGVGFAWTVRVMGFVMLFNAIVVLTFTRTRVVLKVPDAAEAAVAGVVVVGEAQTDVERGDVGASTHSGTAGGGLSSPPHTHAATHGRNSNTLAPLTEKRRKSSKRAKSEPLLQFHHMRSASYTLLTFGVFFSLWGIFYAYYYVRPFSLTLGASQAESFHLLLILNGVGIPGRILPALISQRFLGPVNTLVPVVLFGSLMLYVWLAVDSLPALYVFVSLFGLPGGGVQSLFPAAVASLSDDLETVGARIGLCFTIVSPACLSGPPIAGALIQSAGGSYVGAQLFGGTVMAVGGVLVAAARLKATGLVWNMRV